MAKTSDNDLQRSLGLKSAVATQNRKEWALMKGPLLISGPVACGEGERKSCPEKAGEGCPWQMEGLECPCELQIPALPSHRETTATAGARDPQIPFLSFPFGSTRLWCQDDKYCPKEFQNAPYSRFTY